ncbi:hypothetical protein [Pseudonocardia nigra]|uniref:hypothetical protein n=1 Tax=Pseudonocardia nigra TaxID=1921578 RepID=UPI001C5E63F9|nr:hypothetical protein [Pseudonocardia nigra]
MAAAVAGLVAGQLMEAPTYLQRSAVLAVKQDIFDEAGAILRAPQRHRRIVGWAGHSVLAVAIVQLYAAFFAAVAHNDHLAWWGIVAGAIHGLLGGIVVGSWPDLHPEIPRATPPPGVFYRHYGSRDVTTFVVGHLWFGAVAGTLYALLHADLPPTAAL